MHERSGDPRLARALELLGQLDGYRRRALEVDDEAEAAEQWRRFDGVLAELTAILANVGEPSAS